LQDDFHFIFSPWFAILVNMARKFVTTSLRVHYNKKG